MSVNAFLEVNEDSQLVRQGLENLAADIPKVGRLGIYRTAQRIIKHMKQSGAPSTSPVQWDSLLQMVAYFASNGFGRGIPTVRTGEYQDGWVARPMDTGYAIENMTEGAKFIGGDEYGFSQSKIHQGRYPIFANVALEEIYELPADVVDQLKLTAAEDGIEVN